MRRLCIPAPDEFGIFVKYCWEHRKVISWNDRRAKGVLFLYYSPACCLVIWHFHSIHILICKFIVAAPTSAHSFFRKRYSPFSECDNRKAREEESSFLSPGKPQGSLLVIVRRVLSKLLERRNSKSSRFSRNSLHCKYHYTKALIYINKILRS